jgi:copper chaperone NosL
MKTIIALIIAIFLVIALVSGCSRKPNDGPPEVRYGQDECALCGMIVSDERHAAAMRAVVDGETRDLLFDDVGDMIEYEQANPSAKPIRRYVHDFETRQRVDASHAKFVHDAKVHTPMGSGILAFADESRARGRGQQVVQWGGLQAQSTAASGPCCDEKDKDFAGG